MAIESEMRSIESDAFGLPEYFIPLSILSRAQNRVVLIARVRPTAPLAVSQCVIKLLTHPHTADDADMFVDEFLRLDALQHPNWVRPLLFGELLNGGYFLALQQEQGIILADLPKMPWGPACLDVCHGMLSGLAALHFTKHAHLDLHPGQVLVRRSNVDESSEDLTDYEVSLLDLGLSAPFGTPIDPRGTPGYFAPELLHRDPKWDGRADLYSLGAILHELLTSKRAFPGADTAEILRAQLQDFDPTAVLSEPGVPKGIALLLIDLLQSDPDARPRSALEVWERLRDLLPPADATKVSSEPTPSTAPPFLAREEECRTFAEWLANTSGPLLNCSIHGEPGVGRTRLRYRLRALAFTEGWRSQCDQDDRSQLVTDSGRTLTIAEAQVGILTHHSRPLRTMDDQSLHIVLQPFARHVSELMVQSLGVQSMTLVTDIAELSLGNPSLLLALVRQIDPYFQLDIDTHLRTIVGHMMISEPPSEWVAWIHQLLSELSPTDRNHLLSAAVLTGTGLNPSMLGMAHANDSDDPRFTTLLDRGLLDSNGYNLSSPLWSWAIQSASGAALADLLQTVADSIAEHDLHLSENAAEDLARTSIRAGCPSVHFFLSAWNLLAGQGLLERATNIAIDFVLAELLEGTNLLDPATRTAVLTRCMVHGNMVCRHAARRIPLFAVRQVRTHSCDATTWTLFRAWVFSAWSQTNEALELVSSLERPSTEELRFVWYVLQVGAMQALEDNPSNLLHLLQELDADRFADINLEANLRIRAASPALGIEKAHVQMAMILGDVPSLAPNNQASYWMNEGLAKHHVGRYEEAYESISNALTVYERFQLETLGNIALQNLSAISFASGNLDTSAKEARRVYAAAFRRGAWRQCADALYNIVSIALFRGQLGAARNAVQELKRIAPRVGRKENEQDSRCADAMLALKLGQLSRVDAILGDGWSVDDSMYPKALALLGESKILQGDFSAGRSILRRSIESMQDQGMLDDAAEVLVSWLLCEVDMSQEDSALRLFQEFESHQIHCSAPVRALMLLCEAEMASLNWLDANSAVGGADLLLDAARTELDHFGLRYYTWRPFWRMGQSHLRHGRRHDAATCLDEARVELMDLLRSIDSPRLAESFLALPSPSDLLEDIGRVG